MIWATIYSLADSATVGNTAIPDMGVWNPPADDSASWDSTEEGVGLAGVFLASSESGHVSASPGSSDHEIFAAGTNNRCSTPRKMRRGPQSCKILPAPGNSNTRGSVGNPGNTEGSGENQEPGNDRIFTPMPGEDFLHNLPDFDFANLQGWTICPRAKSDNKPLTAVCDSGNPEDVVSTGIGWGLSNVTPCTYEGYNFSEKKKLH